MNNQEKLENILNQMDIPQFRKNDMGWLMRNIRIRNQNHPDIEEAVSLINTINKEINK